MSGPSIAIVGMACVYPDARSPEELWENILAQRRAFRRIPAERLCLDDYFSEDPAAPDRTYGVEAAVIEGYEFDRARFRVAGSTYRAADHAHWLALDVAARALADAGLAEGDGLPRETTGVLVGNTLTGEFSRANALRLRWPYARRVLGAALAKENWPPERREEFLARLEADYKAPFPPVGEETLAGGLSNTIAGRICNHFDLKGGGYTVDGACASSLLAVAGACSSLAAGDLDAAIAGGVDLSLDPFEIVGFAKTGALAPGEMRVFDQNSAGFLPGEGCGMVVLMRLDDAAAQGRRVHAVIRGWGVSSDGAGGITRPEAGGQLEALRRAYRRAGFGMDTVSYCEGHGTGTAVGDATELEALSRARREASADAPPAAIGSIKANIGHTKAAAGIAGLLKAAMAVQSQVLPPTTGCELPHPRLAGPSPALRALLEPEPWPRDRPLRASVSAMGFGGINAHVVLEAAAAPRRSRMSAREISLARSSQDAELFLLAAESAGALAARAEALLRIAGRVSRAEMADLAAQLQTRAAAGMFRAAVVASRPAQLAEKLQRLGAWLEGGAATRLEVSDGIFLGGGGRPPRIVFLFPGEGSPAGWDGGAWGRRFGSVREIYARAEPPADAATASRPAVVLASLAGLKVADELGLAAGASIADGLGELAALHWAGVLDEETLLRLAVAGLHFPGPTADVRGFSRTAAAPLFEGGLALDQIVAPRRAVFSALAGGWIDGLQEPRELPGRPAAAMARLAGGLEAVRGAADLLVEVGPGSVLTDLARAAAGAPAAALDAGGDSLQGLLRALGAAFALGAPVKTAALFAGRLTRPFPLDWKPGFFASPCEAAPRFAGAAPPAPARVETRTAPPPAEPAPGAPLELIRRLVVERTELPASAVRDDSRMLSDLHLNSITVAQLVSEAARQLGLPRVAELTEFADASAAEIARALEELQQAGGAARDTRTGEPPAGVDKWVRAFTIDLVETKPPAPPAWPEAGPPSRWQIFSPRSRAMAGTLGDALARTGVSGVVVCLPENPGMESISLLLEGARAALAMKDSPRFVVAQHGWGGGGFARTLHLENPGLAACVVNLPADGPDGADWIAAEARAATGFTEAHFTREGRRFEPRLKLAEFSPGEAGPAFAVGPDDVLLVTGGGKGIAAECALALARETGVRLGLVGRSDPDEDKELGENLARMAAFGARFTYARADVTDAGEARRAAAEIERRLGPVTAVLHGAGANTPQLIGALDEAAFRRTMGPKISGAQNILAAVDAGKLRLFVAFGSIIARTGLPGEADYAAANEWLAALTGEFQARHPRCRCLALEWSVWSGAGMGERLGRIETLARNGVAAISVDEGARMFCELLRRPVSASPLVVTGRFGRTPTLKTTGPALPLRRFLERQRVYYPGVELVVDADLSLRADPYLEDHALQNQPLFPAVLGLEAMAQAAMATAGVEAAPVFENVEFRRPVAVPATRTLTIRLAALQREPGVVEVCLRSEETDFQEDHFRAVCRFGARDETTGPAFSPGRFAAERAGLDPGSDLYGRMLFHGGRFRRLGGYRQLSARECAAEITPDDGAAWFGPYLPAEFVLGDPGARDAALHAIQACVPHRRLLPVGIGRTAVLRRETGPRFARARERSREGNEFVYDVEVTNAGGEVVERWEGLRLRAVERIAAPEAWPEALLAPYLERRLEEMNLGGPVRVALERGPRARGRAAAGSAIQTALGKTERVWRRPDGRPLVAGEEGVSAARADGLTLAVAGAGVAACDLEAAAPRTAGVWRDLLGAEKLRLAERMAREHGESGDTAATRLWAAMECLRKTGQPLQSPLLLESRAEDGWTLLRSGSVVIATCAATTRGSEFPLVAAVAVRPRRNLQRPAATAASSA